MRKSLLALMRRADGRSLARALVALLLVNLVVGGFHAGAMAAAGNNIGVICTLAAQGSGAARQPGAPRPGDECPYCAFGCAAGCGAAPLVPVAPSLAGLPVPRVGGPVTQAIPLDRGVPSPRPLSSNGPRSPPLPA